MTSGEMRYAVGHSFGVIYGEMTREAKLEYDDEPWLLEVERQKLKDGDPDMVDFVKGYRAGYAQGWHAE